MSLVPLVIIVHLLYNRNHIALIPTSALISLFLFGIEELSIQLEEPFSILPIKQLVDKIGMTGIEIQQWWEAKQT